VHWSVATTQPNCEAIAARHLDRRGVTTYHPRFRDTRNGIPRLKSLFPGYLFIAGSSSWRAVLGARCVMGVLGLRSEATSCSIKSEVVEEIRAQEHEDGIIVLPERLALGIRPGAVVRVERGSLFGCEGVCQGMKGRDRVWVLLRIMGRKVKVDFSRADLILA